MDIEASKRFMSDLFGRGPFPGHGVRVDPPGKADAGVTSRGSLDERVRMLLEQFEFERECAETIGDDRVPCLHAMSGTEVFAAALGSPVHRPEADMPFALPAAESAEEADRIEEPDVAAGPLGEIFELADGLVAKAGDAWPVRVCNVQSPFDVAALVWRKESMFLALFEDPDAVRRLVSKAARVIARFIEAFRARYRGAFLVHYPGVWMPAEYGVCMSEDEVGAISLAHFRDFCLPHLVALAEKFGGVSLHSCAKSDHVWDDFASLPGLRYLNLHHPPTPLDVAIEKFAAKAVLVPGDRNGHGSYVELVEECLALARPGSRFFFQADAPDMDEAKRLAAEIRGLCGR